MSAQAAQKRTFVLVRYLALWNEGVTTRPTIGPTEAALELQPAPAADEPEGLRQLLGFVDHTLTQRGHGLPPFDAGSTSKHHYAQSCANISATRPGRAPHSKRQPVTRRVG